MATEGFEQWSEFGKNFTHPMSDVNKMIAEMAQRNIHEYAEMSAEILSNTAKQLEKISEAKKLEDYLTIQREFLNQNIALMTESFQKSLNISLKNFEELNKMFNLHQEKAKQRSGKFTDEKN